MGDNDAMDLDIVESVMERRIPGEGEPRSNCDEIIEPSHSFLDTVIDCLPIELHPPGYRFCGPGTHLDERLERGDRGINPLDDYCREHDLAYSEIGHCRSDADRILAKQAFSRMLSETADSSEKTVALVTTCCMISKIYFDKIYSKIKKKIKRRFKKFRHRE